MCPDFSLENMHSLPVCGVDEVGRGPIAGPVVAACVHIPTSLRDWSVWGEVNDSKRLPSKRREALAAAIRDIVPYGIGMASVAEIDTVNILQATFLAMRRAFEAMNVAGTMVAFVDGPHIPRDFPCEAHPIVKGDTRSVSIAAASIVAKVERDFLMANLALTFPAYGWEANAGYPTSAHVAALATHGISPHHRITFAPVKACLISS